MNELLLHYVNQRPDLFAPSTSKFWDDEHISKGMLEAHLNPNWEAATRKYDFVKKSVEWIKTICEPIKRPKLLDLGCGPGIYAELFADAGFVVTGIDLSPRSIRYASEHAENGDKDINYLCRNYLTISYEQEFDVITLIYCDFGVLSDGEREALLNNVYRALKPGGLFIVDAFTETEYEGRPETKSWEYSKSGFWSDHPHVCLESFYRYDAYNTYADQYVIVGNDGEECYNLWNHAFSPEEMQKDLRHAGFDTVTIYSDVAGEVYHPNSKTMCAVADKTSLS
ncbi:MAG: Methyltransferase type 11 [Herbinix sp.]|jgi:SAM-dependent methyltransferase|nr:Methyltransferase type 11 [Herbinix sp.]